MLELGLVSCLLLVVQRVDKGPGAKVMPPVCLLTCCHHHCHQGACDHATAGQAAECRGQTRVPRVPSGAWQLFLQHHPSLVPGSFASLTPTQKCPWSRACSMEILRAAFKEAGTVHRGKRGSFCKGLNAKQQDYYYQVCFS